MENFEPRKFLIMSRYNEKRFLLEIEPKTFKIIGDTDFMGIIFSEDGKSIYALDPTGGPMISVGSMIHNKVLIKSIVLDKDKKDFLILTEN